MDQKTCPNCGHVSAAAVAGCERCSAPDERTVLLTGDDDQRTVVVNLDEDQRTVVVTPDMLRPTPPSRTGTSPQQWGAPPAQHQAPPAPAMPLANGYPEELTTSLAGSLLGARALPPRPVPKTNYRIVVPVLILALLLAIVVGMAITTVASGAIENFFDRIITAG